MVSGTIALRSAGTEASSFEKSGTGDPVITSGGNVATIRGALMWSGGRGDIDQRRCADRPEARTRSGRSAGNRRSWRRRSSPRTSPRLPETTARTGRARRLRVPGTKSTFRRATGARRTPTQGLQIRSGRAIALEGQHPDVALGHRIELRKQDGSSVGHPRVERLEQAAVAQQRFVLPARRRLYMDLADAVSLPHAREARPIGRPDRCAMQFRAVRQPCGTAAHEIHDPDGPFDRESTREIAARFPSGENATAS